MTLPELITRLEQATEGSRELSWDIADHIGWAEYWYGMTLYLPPGQIEGSDETCTEFPQFSESIDAALTLLPEGAWLDMGHRWRNDKYNTERVCGAFISQRNGMDGGARAQTFPLAICLAAMRARLAMEGGT